jgi:hypothetical protein
MLNTNGMYLQVTITPTTNADFVNEPQQNSATDYVYSSNPGDNDLYGLAALSITPQQVFGVTTRAFVQKSDAGARSGALSSSWQWLFRTDVVDPNTGLPWTPTGVNNVQVGPVCVS